MKTKGSICIVTGLLLIAAALFFTGRNLYDNATAERAAENAVGQLETMIGDHTRDGAQPTAGVEASGENGVYVPELPDYVKNPEMEMPVLEVDGVPYIGMLYIPALDLELPVAAQWDYPTLDIAPCRYSGSAYLNNMVICAHNYSSFFSGIKNLNQGDQVLFVDGDGNRFTYQVIGKETLQPRDTQYMTEGDWDLTLFTCTVGGQSRVTVRCELL